MKRKGLWIPLIVFGGVVTIVGSFCLAVIGNGTCTQKLGTLDPENAIWMSKIDDSKKINDIVIPGSHDAATDTMNWLAKTQAFSLGDQLQCGCRYFDLRTNNTNGTKEGLVIYHSIIDGRGFLDVLGEIKNFITVNSSETLLLDFQHFKNDAAELTYQALKDEIGSYMVAKPEESTLSDLDYISSLTLGQTRGKCVVFWGEEMAMASEKADLFARNDDECTRSGMSMNSEYLGDLHKKSSKEFIANALPLYFDHIKEKISSEGNKGIFILQCQLTDGKLIFGPWAREKTHMSNISSYIDKLKNDKEKLGLLNVVMRDFMDQADCEQIIKLNSYK